MSDEKLRAIELDENTERLALQIYEESKQRLAEIRQVEAKKSESDRISGPHAGQKLGRGRPNGKSSGSTRSVAEASGVPERTVRDLESHVAIANEFPFMQGHARRRGPAAGDGV